ncbi:MAG: LamG-like jellyroll fold domain-containing protein [Deltaproteobacteria bacterium]
MSASLIHSVQNNTGSQTITVSGLMDKAGNAIKDNITNGNRFIVDNTLPSLAFSLRDPHSPNIVGCSRTLSTLLNIDTGDAGDQMYIKSIYTDNSSLRPVTPTLDNISLQNYTNDNLTQGFGVCETGGNHLDLDNNSWPQQYYGCERTITVWVEDYAGNIKKVSDNISYDNVSAKITSVTSSNSDIRAGSYPHYGIGTPVTVNVLFSEPLKKGNGIAPEIYLDTGFSSSRTGIYASGSETDNHSYTYTVTEGDNTTDLSLDNQTLGKQESYFEMSGCPVNLLTLPEKNSNHSLSTQKELVLDGIHPEAESITGPVKKIGYPGSGIGPYKSGDNISLVISFSEPVLQKDGDTARLNIEGPYSATTNFTNGFAVDNLSASMVHTVGAGSLTDNVTIKIHGVADLGGNTIKERSRDNATFFVDNKAPKSLSITFLKTDNSSLSCTRVKDVRLRVSGEDDDFIKAVYLDNSSTIPTSASFNNVNSSSFDNNSVQRNLNECGSGNHTDRNGNVWPEKYFGCEQSVYAWLEDYAGNISSISQSINYDPSYAEIISLKPGVPKANIETFPYYKPGEIIEMKLGFSEEIEQSGNLSSIFIDSDNGSAIEVKFNSDVDKDNHTYKYTVQVSDNISELKQHSNLFSYNGAMLTEMSLCTIDNLTLPQPGSAEALSPDNISEVSIDTVPPTISLEIYDVDNSTVTPRTLTNERMIGFKIMVSDDRALNTWELFNTSNNQLKIGDNLTGSDNKTFSMVIDNHTLLDNTSNIIQSIKARVTDLAGNVAEEIDNITLDNILPRISSISVQYTSAKGDQEADNGSGFMQIDLSQSHQNLLEDNKYKLGNLISIHKHDNHSYPVNLNKLSIKFEEPISNGLSADNGSCEGMVQISADNFSSANQCRDLGSPVTTDNQTWDINFIRLSNGAAECPNHYQNGSICKASLLDNLSYSLKIQGFKDFANNVGDNLSVDFKTTETPIVKSNFPEDQSQNISVYTAPYISFNQFMDPDSLISGKTVLVSCSPNPTDANLCDFVPRLEFYNKQLMIHPKGKWPENTTVEITVKGAFNENGSLEGAYSYLQGDCGIQGPGIRNEDNLTQGGEAPNYNCGEYSDDRVFLNKDHQFTFTTRGSLDNSSSSLVLHFTFDNNTLDHSDADGSFQDASVIGTENYAKGKNNDNFGAYQFKDNDYLNVSSISLNSNPFSVCLWVLPGSFVESRMDLLNMGNSGLKLGYKENGKKIFFYNDNVTTSNPYGLMEWTHLCVTYDGSNNLELYANGEALKNAQESITLGTFSLQIGASYDGSNNWNGRIDDFKLFDRKLAGDEIFDLYFEESRDLEGFFPLAGNALDHSGHQRNGGPGSITGSNGWSGTSGSAVKLSEGTGDDIVVSLNDSLNTPHFTYIAWGYPEVVAESRTAYKPLISTAKIDKTSLSQLGEFAAPEFNDCAWIPKTADNVTLKSDDSLNKNGDGQNNFFDYLSGNITTGNGLKITSIKNHSDNKTYGSNASFESFQFGKLYLIHKVSDSKINLIETSNLNKAELSNTTYDSLEIEFQVCDEIKISLKGNSENSNIVLEGGGGQKSSSFEGWFLEHHRSDKEGGVHYQRFREFYTDNTTSKFDCYDTYLLNQEDHCPAVKNLDDGTSQRNTVDYKAWQQLAVRGDGQELSLFRNAEVQKSITSRNTNLRYHDNLTIGAINSDYQYQGRIDDVRLYSRPLTDREIKILYSVVDIHAPVPGDSGKLTFSGNTLSWSEALDDISDNSSLKYRVVKNSEDRIHVVETAMRNGVVLCNWDNCSGLSLENLSEPAYYNVLVKDKVGNINSYQSIRKF